MNAKKTVQGVYLVTDTPDPSGFDLKALVSAAVEGGVSVVQYRDKRSSARRKLETIRTLQPVCRQKGALFIVNDRADLALAGEADGVHLGQKDMPIAEARKILGRDRIIGGTASTMEEARQVEAAGADYLGFGHIYATPTKYKGYAPRGPQMLAQVCRNLSIPVVAIGGIGEKGAAEVLQSGAAGFAVSSAVCGAEDPRRAAGRLRAIYEGSFPE